MTKWKTEAKNEKLFTKAQEKEQTPSSHHLHSNACKVVTIQLFLSPADSTNVPSVRLKDEPQNDRYWNTCQRNLSLWTQEHFETSPNACIYFFTSLAFCGVCYSLPSTHTQLLPHVVVKIKAQAGLNPDNTRAQTYNRKFQFLRMAKRRFWIELLFRWVNFMSSKVCSDITTFYS